jgi:LysR family transcriptional regulator, regulator for bpeEF and oprC
MASLDLYMSFASAARNSSFARAARELGISPSAVAKNIARLERELGIRLFHRTTRQVTLTQDGEMLQVRIQRVLEDVADLEAAVAGVRTEPTGTLRVEAPITFGRRVLLPALARLRRRYPKLPIEARFSDEYADLIRDGLDCAIRVGALDDSALVARRIGSQTLVTCASRAYLRRHGTPRAPADLAEHACLLLRVPSSGRDWAWRFRSADREVTLHPDSMLRLGDGEALVAAAVAGLGVVHVPDYMAAPDLSRGRLVEVLESFRPQGLPISIVYPGQRDPPLRLRVLIDILTAD